ncbi:hypothetical protein HMPREF9123_0432 [Neisseria bacilliformis ATCC BAA-1200]|uniref:Uncharacterized protein n=1 Tax=Neisseria bacilliformis ATCC BAA-1200 TaxID=888742 RepID=F2B9R0_9NEIS|nr:hypothetical protein HMPREF9123_0432 [Neisseria bacilliformis ATCC BAA-1200]
MACATHPTHGFSDGLFALQWIQVKSIRCRPGGERPSEKRFQLC